MEVGGRKWEVKSGRWEVGRGDRWEVGSGRWEVGGGKSEEEARREVEGVR